MLGSEFTVITVVLVLLYLLHRVEYLSRLVLGYFVLIITNRPQTAEVIENISTYNEWYRQVVGIALTDTSEETEIAGIPE